MVTAGKRVVAGIVLVTFAACSGCATTATISRTNGRIYRLDRASVGDIDFPGNVIMTVGSVFLGVAGLVLLSMSTSDRQQSLAPAALIYGVPGLGMLAFGGYQYGRSTSAARAFSDGTGPVYRERPPTPPVDRSQDWMSPPRAADRPSDRAVDRAADPAWMPPAPAPAAALPAPPPPAINADADADADADRPSVRRTPHVSAAPRPAAPPADAPPAAAPNPLQPAPPATER